MSTAEAASIDPYEQLSDIFVQNTYPAYEKLRAEAPIYKNPNAERWLFSRYCDVSVLVRDLRLSSGRYSAASTATALMHDERSKLQRAK
jgi:hypothetical protein